MDRNKTQLTHDVTTAAISYLRDRGFKPVETEVPVYDFGIVDVAGVCQPTRSEAVMLKLLRSKPYVPYARWARMSEAQRDAQSQRSQEWNNLYYSLPQPLTAAVEVKTARQDFKRDQKWTKPAPADLRYLAVSRGLLRPGEAPAGWAIIEVDSAGRSFLLAPPVLTPISIEQKLKIVLQIGMRHFNRHEFAASREMAKEERLRYNGGENRIRMGYAMQAVLRIGNGDGRSVEDILSCFGIRGLPASVQAELKGLWGQLKTATPAAGVKM